MVGQSFAIIALILVMCFMFLRAGRRAGALFALPLISVSVFHLIGWAIYRLPLKTPFSTSSLHIGIDVLGLIVGVVLCFILSKAINVKKLRYVYFVSCAVFLAALLVAYVRYLLR